VAIRLCAVQVAHDASVFAVSIFQSGPYRSLCFHCFSSLTDELARRAGTLWGVLQQPFESFGVQALPDLCAFSYCKRQQAFDPAFTEQRVSIPLGPVVSSRPVHGIPFLLQRAPGHRGLSPKRTFDRRTTVLFAPPTSLTAVSSEDPKWMANIVC
jgi:hypothetical protein